MTSEGPNTGLATLCIETSARKNGQVFTTDYVLDETFTLLFKGLTFAQAKHALQRLEVAPQMTDYSTVTVRAKRHRPLIPPSQGCP